MAIVSQELQKSVEMRDLAPEMAEDLSKRLGRELTIEEIKEEGLEALRFLREEGKCPVCQEGEVRQIPSLSCGIDIRCLKDDCQMVYTRPEIDPHDPIIDETIAFGVGHKVLAGRKWLEEKREGEEKS